MNHMSSSNQTTSLCALLLLLLAVSGAAGQGTLTIGLGVPSPGSFDTVGGAVAGQNVQVDAAVNLVRTEALALTLVTTPTPRVPLSAQLQPRNLQLWVAAEAVSPLNLGFGDIYLDLAGAVTPVALFDSFSNMFHPTFGPGLGDVTNTLNVPIFAEFYHPSYAFPLPPLLFQAIAEDTPGNGLLLSGAVRVIKRDHCQAS